MARPGQGLAKGKEPPAAEEPLSLLAGLPMVRRIGVREGAQAGIDPDAGPTRPDAGASPLTRQRQLFENPILCLWHPSCIA
jgi:hypothetical protein